MLNSNAKLINTLKDLISYKTVSNDLEMNEECLDYIERRLSSTTLKVTRHNSRGIQSLVATTSDTMHSKVMLQAHMDVVPGDDDLFTMAEKGGKLYGRGVYDMKFAAACYIELVEELKDKLDDLSLTLVFTTDEEIGGVNGCKYLLEEGYSCDVCVIPDGGNNWQIESRCNDIWLADLHSVGLSAHGSRPWEGENAIYKLMEGLLDIHRLFGQQSAGKNSLTLSQIQGGYAENQVPDSAKATLDMRFINYKQYEVYRKAIELIAHEKGLRLETRLMFEGERVPLDHPEIKKFLKVAARIHGEPLKSVQSLGSSDAHYFAKANIPTIVIRPEGGSPHSEGEWIDKNSLIEFYNLMRTYVVEASATAKVAEKLDSEKVPV